VRGERRSSDRDSEASVQLEILDRKTQTNKQLYDGILQRLRETDIVAGLQTEGIRVSIPANRPNSQYAPNKTRTTLFALGIGLALGIAAALGLEFLDQTVKSSDHITESIGLPVLGTVPAIGLEEKKWWAPKFKLPGRKIKRSPPKLLEPKGDRRSNIVRESYRSVRTSLLLSSASEPPRTILVTSALPAEGKSTTVANMAISFAHNDARTLVIDLDLRKPALAPLFGVNPDNGMSNFLAGRAEFADLLQQTKHANLALISAGPTPPNPTELLGSKRMRWCLGVASEHFDVVLIDTPPSLELSDALIVSPFVDGVVIVARAGQTPREAVRRTSLRFQRAGARILGALINGADLRNPDYGYYYSGYLSRTYDYHYASTSDS
jgi:capsular exopolysaccharide synthesis family protein